MKFILTGFFVLMIIQPMWAQFNPLVTSRDSINFISKEKILHDLDDYARGIAQNHIQPFTQIKRRDFFDEIQKIKDSADKYDVDGLLTQLLKVNAMIQDEHTYIMYTSIDVFPLACYWFEEGIYITRTEHENLDMLHSRVIAVNDLPIDEVVRRISELSPDKNIAAFKTAVQKYLFDPFVIHGLQVSPSRTNVVYTVVTLKNDTVKFTPVAKDRRSVNLSLGFDPKVFLRYSRKGNYWYKYIDSGNYIYFKYTSCYDQDKTHLLIDMENDLMKEIEERGPAKIVIDMRENGGGRVNLLMPFIDKLSRTLLNKKGRIYVLIGRRTFSAAILNSVTLKTRTYAQLIGEETSGSVVHFGSVRQFTLPETRLMVRYSTQYVVTEEKYDGSLRPDVVIPEKFSDYSKGIDAALNYAVTH